MRCDWELKKLSEVCKINSELYSANDNWEFVNYLDTGNITENQISCIQHINMKTDKLPSRARRKVKNHSILYSTVRPNQHHYGIIKKQPANFLVSTGFAVIEADKRFIDAEFLYYFLIRHNIIEHLNAIAEQSTSAYPSIKPSDIGNLEILLPPLDVQEKIAAILSPLDDKIELNRRINANLELQARTIYHEMFINTQNEQRYTCKAGEYFDIGIGKTPPRKEHQWFTVNPEDVMWVSISDMGSCGTYILGSSEQLTHEAVKKFNIKVIPSGTVLLSFKLTVGRVAITYGEMTTNEAIAHFRTDKLFINEYLYCYLKNFHYRTMGSTSSIATAINSRIVKDMPFIIPAEDEIFRFHFLVEPMFKMMLKNQRENHTLAQIRDTLLPKLISGEIIH